VSRPENEIDPRLFCTIAACPYLLFPGETKPITKLLSSETPLQLDIEYSFGGRDSEGVVRELKIKIPHSDLSSLRSQGERSTYKFLVSYLKEREAEIGLQKNWLENETAMLNVVIFMICAVRTFSRRDSLEKCLQVWLQTMQQSKKNQIAKLTSMVGFKAEDFV